jgi:hypothetical protein
MSDKIKVTFLASVDDRTLLRKLSAEADCTQAELLLNLLYHYGEQEARLMRAKKHGGENDTSLVELAEVEVDCTPVVHVFDNSGELSLVATDNYDRELPLASINQLGSDPGFAEHCFEEGYFLRFKEGVVKGYTATGKLICD